MIHRRRRRPARVRRAAAERLYQQTDDFPYTDDTLDYVLKSIPPTTWKEARERAQVSGRPMRWVLLSLLSRYAKGAIPL